MKGSMGCILVSAAVALLLVFGPGCGRGFRIAHRDPDAKATDVQETADTGQATAASPAPAAAILQTAEVLHAPSPRPSAAVAQPSDLRLTVLSAQSALPASNDGEYVLAPGQSQEKSPRPQLTSDGTWVFQDYIILPDQLPGAKALLLVMESEVAGIHVQDVRYSQTTKLGNNRESGDQARKNARREPGATENARWFIPLQELLEVNRGWARDDEMYGLNLEFFLSNGQMLQTRVFFRLKTPLTALKRAEAPAAKPGLEGFKAFEVIQKEGLSLISETLQNPGSRPVTLALRARVAGSGSWLVKAVIPELKGREVRDRIDLSRATASMQFSHLLVYRTEDGRPESAEAAPSRLMPGATGEMTLSLRPFETVRVVWQASFVPSKRCTLLGATPRTFLINDTKVECMKLTRATTCAAVPVVRPVIRWQRYLLGGALLRADLVREYQVFADGSAVSAQRTESAAWSIDFSYGENTHVPSNYSCQGAF